MFVCNIDVWFNQRILVELTWTRSSVDGNLHMCEGKIWAPKTNYKTSKLQHVTPCCGVSAFHEPLFLFRHVCLDCCLSKEVAHWSPEIERQHSMSPWILILPIEMAISFRIFSKVPQRFQAWKKYEYREYHRRICEVFLLQPAQNSI